MESKKIISVIATIGTVLATVAGVIAFDDRYMKNRDLNAMETRIVEQINKEIATNRDIMIQNLQRDEFDLRFAIRGYDDEKDVPPHMLQKLESVQGLLKELQDD